MQTRALFPVVFLLLVRVSAREGPKFGKYVAKYTEEKFKYVMNSNDRPGVLLEIYSPSCPACQSFAPKLAKAASILREKLPEVKVIAVDGKEDDSTLMRELKTDEFPSIFYFPKGRAYSKGMRIPFKDAANVDQLVEQVERLTGPAVVKLGSVEEVPEPQGGKGPNMVLVSATMVPAYESLAEEMRTAIRWYWVQDESSEEVVSMMIHRGQSAIKYTWVDAEADSLDEDAERFEAFIKTNTIPELLMVPNPYKLIKQWDNGGDGHTRRLLWVVLNSSAASDKGEATAGGGVAPCGATVEGSCSASSGGEKPKQSSDTLDAALDEAMAPYRSMFQQVARIQKNGDEKKAHTILYVDIERHPEWVLENLYIWHAPALIAQRSFHSDRHLYSEEAKLPSTSADVMDWIKKVQSSKVPARPKGERPVPFEHQAQDDPWRAVAALNVESALREAPASLLYSWKSADSFTTDEEKLQIEDDLELLLLLGEWLNKTCEKPPSMLRLDVRKNQVPLGLYAAASIGTLNAPNLYFIHNETGKKKLGIAWTGNISEYRKIDLDTSGFASKKNTKEDFDFSAFGQSKGVFAHGVKDVASWVLNQARAVEGLKVADSIKGLEEQQVSVQSVIDVDSKAQLDGLVQDKSKIGLVEFYSPSCGACKVFNPVYESAARKFSRENKAAATFARVDCSTSGQICNQYGVDGYPTILFFQEGKTSPYGGGRSRDNILGYLEVKAAPDFVEAKTETEARAMARKGKRATLLWLGPRDVPGGKVDSRFEAVLATARDWKHVVQLVVLPSDKGHKEGQLLELKFPGSNTDPKKFGTEKSYSQDEIAGWIAETTVRSEPVPTEQEGPVLKAVGANFREAIYAPLYDGYSVMLEVYAPWCGHCRELAPIYEHFAQQMKDEQRKIKVYKLNGDANDIPFDGFDYKGFPSIFFLSPTAEKVEKVGARTLNDFVKFVNEKDVGKVSTEQSSAKASKADALKEKSLSELLADFKSEPVPTTQTSPVLTVVLKNFLEIVFQEGKSCVLMIYAPWCGHCKAVKEPFEAFAQKMSHRQDLVVAKMNGEENDLPVAGFNVKGYPAIFYVPEGSKEPSHTFTGSNALNQLKDLLASGQRVKGDEL